MTEKTDVWENWDAVLSAASSAKHDHRCELLVCICIAGSKLVNESLTSLRIGGFPSGRPRKKTIRAAAAQLLDTEIEGWPSERSAGYRVLGQCNLLYQATGSDADGELSPALENARRAVADISSADDPLIAGYAHFVLGSRLKSMNAHSTAAHEFAVSRELVVAAGADVEAHWLFRVAPFLEKDAHPSFAFKLVYRCMLYSISRHIDALDVSSAQRSADELVLLASSAPARAKDLSWALSRRARVERARRDVQAFLSTERELSTLAEQHPDDIPMQMYWMGCVSENARKLTDFGRSTQYLQRRIALRVRRLGDDVAPEAIRGDTAMALVARYTQARSVTLLSNLGNDLYDLALNLYDSGAIAKDRTARDNALALLDAAEHAWRDFAGNGRHAVAISRARIELLDANPPIADLTNRLLIANDGATQSNTRRRALHAAVRYGTVGSSEVGARITQRLTELDPRHHVERALLRGLQTEFKFRAAQSPVSVPDKDAEAEALDTARLLRPGLVSLDLDLESVAWRAAAAAVGDDPNRGAEKLERLLHAITCVAELMVTISTTADRAAAADRYAVVFSDAAQLAAQLGDHAAADLIMEAARRDRVGLILAELVADPAVDKAVRAAAMDVQHSSGRTPIENADDEPPEMMRERSAAIITDRERATSHAEQVLGPLGALCDVRSIRDITAARVLLGRSTHTALLQLLPLPAPTTASINNSRDVLRRVTIVHDGHVREYLDLVSVPLKLTTLGAGSSATFAWRRQFADVLLPPVLIETLHAAEDVVRLLIVPTGFYHVPFDALPVSDSTMLIDRAATSVHGSMTGMLAQMHVETSSSIEPTVAVYDSVLLKHTETELAALNRKVARITHVTGADQLRVAFTAGPGDSPSMLAMGVHGSGDDHGWGQAKRMPDGTVITAADVFSWVVPQLCVLASCYSSITTSNGVELGGFPHALMLRGATTVIGGLYKIDDQSTAEIMTLFWDRLHAAEVAVYALRSAKLDWITAQPSPRPRAWAGLIAYGAAMA
ncbi:CHAT domain-containing protein [Antrihabitans sp. NCIMB 15449]